MLGVFPAKSNWITGDKPLAADVDNMSALINNFNPSAKGSITIGSNPATLSELLIGTTGQLLGVVAGLPAWTAPLVDNLAWTAYVPATTNITIGNGTLAGFYKKIGKTVFGRCSFLLGGTSAIATDATLGFPSVPVAFLNSGYGPLGIANYYDTSATTPYIGFIGYTGALVYTVTNAHIAATIPFTWAVGDSIQVSFTYEEA